MKPTPRSMADRAWLFPIFVAALGGCGGDSGTTPSQPRTPGMTVESFTIEDTIEASGTLTMRVIGPSGEPTVAASMEMASLWVTAPGPTPPLTLKPFGIPGVYSQRIVLGTSAEGLARASVRIGERSGEAAIEVRDNTNAYIDTVLITIEAGALVDIQMTPTDTVLVPGRSFPFAVEGIDRFGNVVAGVRPTLAFAPPFVSVDTTAGTITGLATGFGGTSWEADTLARSFPATVIPDGAFAYSQAIGGAWALRVMNSDGTAARSVLSYPPGSGGAQFKPAWSFDGTKIAAYFAGGIVVTDLSGDTLTVAPSAPSGSLLSWTADGAWVYFTNGEATWRAASDGSSVDSVTTGRGRVSPDGQTVAVSESDGSIWLHDIVGDSRTQLAPSGGGPTWSPDGTMVVFAVQGTSQVLGGAYVYATNGSLVARIDTPGGGRGFGRMGFSPGSDFIVAELLAGGFTGPSLGVLSVSQAVGIELPIESLDDPREPDWGPVRLSN